MLGIVRLRTASHRVRFSHCYTAVRSLRSRYPVVDQRDLVSTQPGQTRSLLDSLFSPFTSCSSISSPLQFDFGKYIRQVLYPNRAFCAWTCVFPCPYHSPDARRKPSAATEPSLRSRSVSLDCVACTTSSLSSPFLFPSDRCSWSAVSSD